MRTWSTRREQLRAFRRAFSHPGDDLEARLLQLVDLQPWDDLAPQVGHFVGGPLVLLLGAPERVEDVVGDFGEAAQGGDVRVLFELLRETREPMTRPL